MASEVAGGEDIQGEELNSISAISGMFTGLFVVFFCAVM